MFLYIIFNKINGKMYVGITKNIKERWRRHRITAKGKKTYRQAIHWAIAKYGESNFIFKPIEILPDLEAANTREKEWIKSLKENNYQLYNETDGGDGGLGYKWTDEQKKIASERNSGTGNPMYGIQLFGEANGNYGKEMKPHVKNILLTYRRKLSDEKILEIKTLFETGNYTQTSLAKQFNVNLTTIHSIVKEKRGSNKNKSKILTKKNMTIEDARSIKTMYASGNYTQKELAKQFNCSSDHINAIINGRKWKDS